MLSTRIIDIGILTSEYANRTHEDNRRRSHIGRTESEIDQVASALDVRLEGRDRHIEIDLPSYRIVASEGTHGRVEARTCLTVMHNMSDGGPDLLAQSILDPKVALMQRRLDHDKLRRIQE